MKKIKHKKSVIVLIIAIILLVIIGVSVLTNSTSSKESGKYYKTTTVKKPSPFVATGKIKATRTQTVILPQGKVQQVLVENGAQVDEGQQLVTTYSKAEQNNIDDLNQEIIQQQRKVTNAQNQLNTIKKTDVSDDSAEKQGEVAETQANYDEANDTLSNLQSKLQRTQTKVSGVATAPFSGTVSINYSQAGKPQVTIYSNDLVFKANVSEYDYANLKKDTNMTVTALATKESTETKINFISTEPATTSKANDTKYEFIAPLNGHFMNGQTARASLEQEGLSIPMSSVRNNGVFVVNKKKHVSFQSITGKAVNGYYKVEKGLHLGQTVITNPDKNLHNGSKVDIDD